MANSVGIGMEHPALALSPAMSPKRAPRARSTNEPSFIHVEPGSSATLTPKRSTRKSGALGSVRGSGPASGRSAIPKSATPGTPAAAPASSSHSPPYTVRTVDSSKKKLEAVHATEVSKLRRQVKELEEARATLLRATKHITHPLEQALAAEVSKRKSVEAELAALRGEMLNTDAAREAADIAKREAAGAIEARERAEAQAALELLRAQEFISSHDEKVERVRQYAEALESMIQTVRTA